MNDSTAEAISMIFGLLMYFGGLLIWPVQACVRRRWDARNKALAVVFAVHLLLLLMLTLVTDALLRGDAIYAWWAFVLLNACSSFASLVCWLAASDLDARGLPKRTG